MIGEDNPLHDILARFARDRVAALAKRSIWHLQRSPSSGRHPYGWDMGTLWNLYSWDVQNGPIDHSELLEDLVKDVVARVVADVSEADAVLLTTYFSLDEIESGARDDEVIIAEVLDAVSSHASCRNLDRFDPDYRWYEGRD